MQKVLFFLGELSDADLDWLITSGEKREVAAGTVLIREAQPVDALYILLEGTLVVSVEAMGDRELARLHSGEVVGEMSFIESRPPSATVKSLEQSLVLALPRRMLAAKLEEDVGFASRFYRALAILLSSRLRGTVKQLGDAPPPSSNHRSGSESGNGDGLASRAIAETRLQYLMEQLGVKRR
ncbi:MAG: cyclic nucleotide-binding domain-containing protein [Synechococcales bacterium]|nr:cyclic nucleotide-binding domain-containing protein [Synechococcales bacterium]